MNRFKRELRLRGVKIENDYECLPCPCGSVSVEAVMVSAEYATVTHVFNVMTVTQKMNRDGTLYTI